MTKKPPQTHGQRCSDHQERKEKEGRGGSGGDGGINGYRQRLDLGEHTLQRTNDVLYPKNCAP